MYRYEQVFSKKTGYIDPQTGRIYYGQEAELMYKIRKQEEDRRTLSSVITSFSGYTETMPAPREIIDMDSFNRINVNWNINLEPPKKSVLDNETIDRMHEEVLYGKKVDKDLCDVCGKKHSEAKIKLIKYQYKLYRSLLPNNQNTDMSRFERIPVCAALQEIKLLLHKK